MKHFIVPRAPQSAYEQMIKIHDWCKEAFGKEDYFVRWNVNFARGTEDYVEFDFRNDADASAFVFQWGDYCVSKERQWELGFCSWTEP
mgnify:CR=1 FL=1